MTRSATTAATIAAGALVFNAFVWGVSWWPMRALQGYGLHPLWTTCIVYLAVVAVLLAVWPGAVRGFARHPSIWLLAVATGITNLGFNWAVTIGDVVRVVLLFYLMPAWAVLAAWALLGERPTAGSLLRLLLAMAGVVVVLKTPESPWPVPHGLADWLALVGGLSFAVNTTLLRKFNRTPAVSRMLAMFGGSGLMAGAVALTGTLQGALPAPALSMAGLPVLAGLGLAFMLGNTALQYGASRLPTSTTSVVMLTEILFASASAALLGAAVIGGRTLLGGGLIVLAAVLASLAPATARPPAH